VNAGELNLASWYKTDLFERLATAKSASEVACVMSGVEPVGKPNGDEDGWMLRLVHTACDIASQWVQRPHTVTVGGDAGDAATINVAPDQVRLWFHRNERNPMHTLDEMCGHLLQEVGVRKVLTQAEAARMQRTLRTFAVMNESASPGMVWDGGVAYLALTIAGAMHRRSMLKKWGGWASFCRGLRPERGNVQRRLDDPEIPPLMKGLVGVAAIVSGMPVDLPAGKVSDVLAGVVRDYLSARPERVIDTAKGIMRRLVDALTSPGTQSGGESPEAVQGVAMDGDGERMPQASDMRPLSLPEVGGVSSIIRVMQSHPGTKPIEVRIDPGLGAPLEYGDTVQEKFAVEPSARYDYDPLPCELPAMLADLRMRSEAVERALRSVMWTTPPVNPHRGYTSGALDEGGMHRLAAFGDGRVFERMPEAGEGRVLVGILLDASGSMRGEPIADARAVAHGMSSAFARNSKVRLRCWAHAATGQGYTGPKCFIDEVDLSNSRACLRVHAGNENADGVAIRHVCSELRRDHRAKRRVLVVVSDGYPSVRGLYTGTKAAEHTAASVRAARHAGISVLSVIIGNAIKDADADAMYGRKQWIRVHSLSGACVPLARAIRRYVESASCGI
jgi:hypothetical protein